MNYLNNENEEYDIFENWDEIGLNEDLLRGIYSYGFEKPSIIQRNTIPSIIKGKDLIAQAQSGTGKTGAFVIGSLTKIDVNQNNTQVIILSPTRELTNQIFSVVNCISDNIKNIKTYCLVGGSSIEKDINYLKKNKPHIIVACSGRLLDMLNRGFVDTENIKLFVMDETDELLSECFKEQVYNIFQFLSEKVQVLLFSATYSENIKNTINKIVRNPVNINVNVENLTLEGILQFYIAVEDDIKKQVVIKDLFSCISISQTIIYANSIERVNSLYNYLNDEGFPVCYLHSNMNKFMRENIFKEFVKGKYRFLISSNITSRGIDIQQVSFVINFDIPSCNHTYLHRIGRVGRYGRKGIAINLITKRDINKMKEIENYYNCQINELPKNFNNLL